MRPSRLALIALAFAAGTAALADEPGPGIDRVRLRGLSYAGTGCPIYTVSGGVSSDARALTLIFDELGARALPGQPLAERRRNCQLALDLTIPPGWSLALGSLRADGYVAHLPARGGAATIQAAHVASGSSASTRLGATVRGPVDGPVGFEDHIDDPRSLTWTPCNVQRSLGLNLQVRVDGAPTASLEPDEIDAVRWVFGLRWKRCG